MHLSHKYWARKPHNVVAAYIEAYSRRNDIVLDPFFGSGTTILEGLALERRCIGVDVNPAAARIVNSLLLSSDLDRLEKEMLSLLEHLDDKLAWTYETKCSCGKTSVTRCAVWERGADVPKEIRYECSACGPKRRKTPDTNDKEVLSRIHDEEIPLRVACHELQYPTGMHFLKRERQETLRDLFTARNLLVLTSIWGAIDSRVQEALRPPFDHAFTSMVHLASKLAPVRPSRPFSSFWPVHSYWIPLLFMESNALELLRNAALGKQGVLRAKHDVQKRIGNPVPAENWDDLRDGADYLLLTRSAADVPMIPSTSIDFVFADPPYGGDIQYYELSWLWNVWFGQRALEWYKDEITVNSRQEKTLEDYRRSMELVFQEIARVVKPDARVIVTFFQRKHQVMEALLESSRATGMQLEHILFQPFVRQSANSLLNPANSAIGDYILRLRVNQRKAEESGDVHGSFDNKTVTEVICEILRRRGEPSFLSDILRGQHLLFSLNSGLSGIPETFLRVLEKEKFVQVNDKRWWVSDESMFNGKEIAVPVSERVEETLISLLSGNPLQIDEIANCLFRQFPDLETPSLSSIRRLLATHARLKNGHYHLNERHAISET